MENQKKKKKNLTHGKPKSKSFGLPLNFHTHQRGGGKKKEKKGGGTFFFPCLILEGGRGETGEGGGGGLSQRASHANKRIRGRVGTIYLFIDWGGVFYF